MPDAELRSQVAGPRSQEADGADARVGDLAIVLHTHMPYVEGYGTFPFGEEWLFEAVARSHLRVLGAARRATLTVTPVLADQLEAPGVADRLTRFARAHRIEAARRDARAAPELRAAAEAEARLYSGPIEEVERRDGDLLAPFADAQRAGRVALMASAATHAILPLLASRAGIRLQLDAGLRSHERRFGPTDGLWLPECAYRPGIDAALAERGVRWTCVDASGREGELDALAPVRTPAGPTAFTIDWLAVELVWGRAGYPADPAYLDYHRLSANGIRLWSIGGQIYDPGAALARAARHASEFVGAVRRRLAAFAAERGRPGLCVFAVDTELLGDWWAEGPDWLAAVGRVAAADGVELVTLPEALARHPPEARPLAESSWGEGKDLRTWDAPAVADLAWGARRLELRLLRALGSGIVRPAAERAARELLAVQASDWAFMDSRGEAGDYGYERALAHSEALLEALGPGDDPDPRVRNLAPDLDLAPLLVP
jgi:1,4-alpha-glucan branching enzyme